jgi:hypothetical protein
MLLFLESSNLNEMPMLPLSSSSPFQLNPKAHMKASQRSGADWSHPDIQKEIAKLAQTDMWKNYEKGFQDAAKLLDYTNKASWKTRLERVAYWVKRLWTRLRSDIMGMIRGIRVHHKHIMNRFMPGIQDWIHKELKTQNTVEMIRVKGRNIPVHFTTFQLPKAKSADGVHRIAIFGDPGFNNNILQMNVDGSIALAKAKGHEIDAGFLTGDICYAANPYDKNNATRGSGDSRSFHSNVGAVYHDFIKHKVPIFTPMGNNDADQGHAEAFANYMSLPRYFKVVAGDSEFFFVDETIMSALDMTKLDKRFKTTHYTQEANDLKEAQLYWLEKALSESKQAHPHRKRILIKHFGVKYPRNPDINDAHFLSLRRQSWDRFFENYEKYGIDAEINGHEHLLAVNNITHIMGEDGTPKPLARVVPQYTLGSSSHVEPESIQGAYTYDWEKVALRSVNTLRLPQIDEEGKFGAIYSDSCFGMIEVDKPTTNNGKSSNVWINFIKPPTGKNLYYQGLQIPMNPGDVEHEGFRLLYRNLIERPLGANHTNS